MIAAIKGTPIAHFEELNVIRVRSSGRFYAFVDRLVQVPDGPHAITDLLIATEREVRDTQTQKVRKVPLWDRMFAHKKAIFESNARVILVITGVQAGKSVNGLLWMYDKITITGRPGLTWLISGPRLKELERQVIQYYRDFFDQTPLRGEWIESKSKYRLNDGKGGELVFIYAETDGEVSQIRAVQGYGIHADEMGAQTRIVCEAIDGRVSGHGGPMFITSTADLRRPYLKEKIWDRGKVNIWKPKKNDYDVFKEGEDPDIEVFQFACVDNPYYSRKALAYAKRNLDDRTFDVMYGGAMPRVKGVIFPEFSTEAHVAT